MKREDLIIVGKKLLFSVMFIVGIVLMALGYEDNSLIGGIIGGIVFALGAIGFIHTQKNDPLR